MPSTKENKHFCPVPFVHLYLDNSTNSRICCVAGRDNIPERSEFVSELWNGDYYKKIRQDMLDGKYNESCKTCYVHEAQGLESDRQRYIERYKDVPLNVENGNDTGKPLDLELRFSNLCNLKCRMCHPRQSSQFEKEVKKHSQIAEKYFSNWVESGYQLTNNKSVDPSNVVNFDWLFNKNLVKIKLLGGEPTIMPEAQKALEYLINIGNTDIKIQVTSNGTNANPKFNNLIKKFKNVVFNFSLDGCYETNDYIRFPSNFESIVKNITDVTEHVNYFTTTMCVQALNIHNLYDYAKFITELSDKLNKPIGCDAYPLDWPTWASYQTLPLDYRKKHIGKFLDSKYADHESFNDGDFVSVLKNFYENTVVTDLNLLKDSCTMYDKIRNQDVNKSIPTLGKLFLVDILSK